VGVIAISLVVAFVSSVIAQENNNLGEKVQVSRSSLTGAATGDDKLTAAKPRGADGLGNPMLGERRPLYRLRSSDVVEVTFTVAPEFNQTLTVQPDGYVMLKDASAVVAQGLTVPEFREAVKKAYSGCLHDPEAAVVLKDFDALAAIIHNPGSVLEAEQSALVSADRRCPLET